jgi:hypothetical protein
LTYSQKPYINAGIFLDYIRTVFLLYLVSLRVLAGFPEEAAVFLMDNYSAHVTDGVMEMS